MKVRAVEWWWPVKVEPEEEEIKIRGPAAWGFLWRLKTNSWTLCQDTPEEGPQEGQPGGQGSAEEPGRRVQKAQKKCPTATPGAKNAPQQQLCPLPLPPVVDSLEGSSKFGLGRGRGPGPGGAPRGIPGADGRGGGTNGDFKSLSAVGSRFPPRPPAPTRRISAPKWQALRPSGGRRAEVTEHPWAGWGGGEAVFVGDGGVRSLPTTPSSPLDCPSPHPTGPAPACYPPPPLEGLNNNRGREGRAGAKVWGRARSQGRNVYSVCTEAPLTRCILPALAPLTLRNTPDVSGPASRAARGGGRRAPGGGEFAGPQQHVLS